ncbi:hypothetical protein GMORB2_5223 [Geosmithia morbida]|uniref:Uncharacterized protein n=1 Tax=Geosmithia morbida TaxID=1094350 RepID=A0A9P4YXZ9_9HYPO|nr:uncharacterized protein GMORB2_5223 [Geosmithia morbida]KAF4124557.1 hypothetical protein GMORB2_5223 [Geosmithia morbida]
MSLAVTSFTGPCLYSSHTQVTCLFWCNRLVGSSYVLNHSDSSHFP